MDDMIFAYLPKSWGISMESRGEAFKLGRLVDLMPIIILGPPTTVMAVLLKEGGGVRNKCGRGGSDHQRFSFTFSCQAPKSSHVGTWCMGQVCAVSWCGLWGLGQGGVWGASVAPRDAGEAGEILWCGSNSASPPRCDVNDLDRWGFETVCGGPCGEAGEPILSELAVGMAPTSVSVTLHLEMVT